MILKIIRDMKYLNYIEIIKSNHLYFYTNREERIILKEKEIEYELFSKDKLYIALNNDFLGIKNDDFFLKKIQEILLKENIQEIIYFRTDNRNSLKIVTDAKTKLICGDSELFKADFGEFGGFQNENK